MDITQMHLDRPYWAHNLTAGALDLAHGGLFSVTAAFDDHFLWALSARPRGMACGETQGGRQ